jgi:hypothetical protein
MVFSSCMSLTDRGDIHVHAYGPTAQGLCLNCCLSDRLYLSKIFPQNGGLICSHARSFCRTGADCTYPCYSLNYIKLYNCKSIFAIIFRFQYIVTNTPTLSNVHTNIAIVLETHFKKCVVLPLTVVHSNTKIESRHHNFKNETGLKSYACVFLH